MAAYGSGAVNLSAQTDRGTTVLNIDIGGGTSKFAIVRNGRVVEATAINVGARLIAFDYDQKLTRIEAAAHVVARHRGLNLEVGAPICEKVRLDLAAALVDALLEVAARQPLSELTLELMIAAPLAFSGDIDVVVFSGGVSEYFYQRNVPAFGDIGPQIARLLRQRLPKALPEITVERPAHGIRATVIGASQFTAQVSGNTLYIAKADLLPLRNLPVVVVDLAGVKPTPAEVAAEIRRRLDASEAGEGAAVALGVRWPHGPAYAQLNALASGMAEATAGWRERGLPIIVVLDVDVARLVGAILSAYMGGYADILCIDGIDLREFDYIDIGEEQPDSHVVTVIVKSLVFTG
jgi:ethanolamine utilization protein EutA